MDKMSTEGVDFGGNTHENRVKTALMVAEMVADRGDLDLQKQFIPFVKEVRHMLIYTGMDTQDDTLLALARNACREVRDRRTDPPHYMGHVIHPAHRTLVADVPTGPHDCTSQGHIWYVAATDDGYVGRCRFCSAEYETWLESIGG